ncbi:MAG: XdhC family protein [Terracidiphilus sp.]|jgi:xanthine/CO dehydrogenase XdhC/CoxF family maturation factor
MTDLARILSVWRELESAGADYALASIVAVQGPSYRKPGALMLLTPEGRRVGTVSGGCLEAEVVSRAWWLTGNGPTIQRYSTADDDGDRPYGSGCGGVVFLLLERSATAGPLLAALERAFVLRVSLAVATVLDGPQIGRRAFASVDREQPEIVRQSRIDRDLLQDLAQKSFANRESIESKIIVGEVNTRARVDYRPARSGLWIFGAGDDAQPLLRLAKELGLFVSVADGRSHLATRERFPAADQLNILPINELPANPPEASITAFGNMHPEDAVVVMTHSFEQDSKILACLLTLKTQPGYIGVLGPQRRTRELLTEAGHLLNLPVNSIAAQADRWLDLLHAPTGLDLGAESPETIALSVLAEIQKVRTSSTALPLRTVRAAREAIAG